MVMVIVTVTETVTVTVTVTVIVISARVSTEVTLRQTTTLSVCPLGGVLIVRVLREDAAEEREERGRAHQAPEIRRPESSESSFGCCVCLLSCLFFSECVYP